MQQIIHTCLMAMRLISSVTSSQNSDLQHTSTFDRALLNASFGYVYVDPGTLKKQIEKALPLFPVTQISA